MENSTKINMPTLKADDIIEKAAVIRVQELDTLINNMADSLSKASSGKNLSKYWKTQDELIKDVITSYKIFNKESNKDNATELIKVTNALKAIAGVDLSNILPNFDEFTKSFNNAKKKVGNLDSAFNVKGFKEVFNVFETLEKQGLDIQEVFSNFGASSDISKLQQNIHSLEGKVGELTNKLINANDAKDALQKELNDFKIGSGFADKLNELDKLKAEIQNIRNEAIVTFNQFLEANKIDKYDWFDNDRFAEYFEQLENGKLTASEAIRQFKTEYDYLLEESFKSNGNSFGLDQLQAFSTKLDSIFQQVEETSNKINDILSNGVIAKSVQNLSEDTTLSDSQRSIFGNILQDEESLKSVTALFQKLIDETNQTKNTEVFNTEQFTKLESLFTSIESSLSSIKGVLVDVGDGEELSPLLKTIANIESAIDNLSSSVKGIGLNMNIDFGSDTELEAKAQAKISNALQAYQNLFEHIKMSSAGGSYINNKFFDFDINQFDTPMSKLQAYIKFIKDMREEAKKMFGGKDILKIDTDDKYWNRASAAMGQVKKTFNEMKAANDTNPLENIFGKTDLTEVISQLENIVSKLDEISVSAKGFAETFKNGLNVNASVEEIEKLTNRVKELEDELARVKAPTIATASQEPNISSDSTQVKSINDTTTAITQQTNAIKELILSWVEAQKIMKNSGINSVEKIAVGNLNNGFASNSNFTGDLDSVSDKLVKNIIQNATDTIDTIIHSHPDYNLAAFSPEDIAYSIIRFATGIQNQIVVGMDEVSVMDVSKIKDINPLEIKEKIEKELSNLINSYVIKEIQNIDNLQSVFNNNFENGVYAWKEYIDLISEKTNSDFLKNVIEKYKDSISDNLANMGSDFKFNNSDELGTYIYENLIKKYVRSYIADSNPDINQSEYDLLKKEASENFKKEFSEVYKKVFSLDDFKNLLTDNEIQPIVKEAFSNILKEFGLKYEDVIKTISVEQLKLPETSMKDAFPDSSTNTNPETEGMEQVEKATKEAVQAKKDFATANEGVQSSIDGSENPLKLEAELMEQIARSAREAADAKKEFVNANKQVKDSAKGSNNDLVGGHSENAEPSGVKKYKKKGYKAHDTGNHDNEKKVSNKAELEQALRELQSEIIASIDESTSFVKEITDFYDSQNDLVKTQTKVGDKNGGVRTYTHSYSTDKEGNTTAWTSHIDSKKYQDQNKIIQEQIKNLQKLSAEKKKAAESERKSTVNQASKDQLEAWKQIQRIRKEIANTNNAKLIEQLEQEKKTYQEQYLVADKILKNNSDLYNSEQRLNELKKISLKTTQQIETSQQRQLNGYDNKLSGYQGKISGYKATIDKFGDDGWTSPEYSDNVQRAQQALKAYKDEVNKLKANPDLINKESLANVEKLGKDFEEATLAIKNMTAAQKGYTQLGAEKAMDKISQMLKENSKMSRQAKADIKAWYDQIKSGNPSASLDVILGKVEEIVRKEKEAGRGGKSMWDAIKEKAFYSAASVVGTYFGLNDIIRYGKEGIDIVREFNTALTEMRKVSDESLQSLKKYQSITFDTADAVGATAKQIQESTADYMRLGESLDKAAESAKTANILLNVSEFNNIEDATKSLVSMGQAYKDLDKLTIVDKLNEVGKIVAQTYSNVWCYKNIAW